MGLAAGDLITELWQVEWRGNVWGGTNADTAIVDLSGWLERPALRGSNADRPARHGAYPGLKRAETRAVEVELTVMVDDPDMSILRAIEDATAYDEDPAEEDLVIWAGTEHPQLVRARLEKAAIPTDHEWSVGHHRARLQWVATDPRRYSIVETVTPVLGMPGGATSGVTFPITFPITFGSGVSSGSLTLYNAGNAPTWPTFTLTGALTAPAIVRADTGQKIQFAPTFTLGNGETMVIDTDARSVTIAGVSRRDAVVSADWFPIPPRQTIVLTLASTGAYDAAAGLTVAYRDAYL
jgi:hypothetical protein